MSGMLTLKNWKLDCFFRLCMFIEKRKPFFCHAIRNKLSPHSRESLIGAQNFPNLKDIDKKIAVIFSSLHTPEVKPLLFLFHLLLQINKAELKRHCWNTPLRVVKQKIALTLRVGKNHEHRNIGTLSSCRWKKYDKDIIDFWLSYVIVGIYIIS